jgi:hypothetical protein
MPGLWATFRSSHLCRATKTARKCHACAEAVRVHERARMGDVGEREQSKIANIRVRPRSQQRKESEYEGDREAGRREGDTDTHTHTHTHARTHAHTHTHTRTSSMSMLSACPAPCTPSISPAVVFFTSSTRPCNCLTRAASTSCAFSAYTILSWICEDVSSAACKILSNVQQTSRARAWFVGTPRAARRSTHAGARDCAQPDGDYDVTLNHSLIQSHSRSRSHTEGQGTRRKRESEEK